MTTSPDTADAARFTTAADLALRVPDAGIADFPDYGHTTVAFTLDTVAGHFTVLTEGTVNLSIDGVPAWAAALLLDALIAGQPGRTT